MQDIYFLEKTKYVFININYVLNYLFDEMLNILMFYKIIEKLVKSLELRCMLWEKLLTKDNILKRMWVQ